MVENVLTQCATKRGAAIVLRANAETDAYLLHNCVEHSGTDIGVFEDSKNVITVGNRLQDCEIGLNVKEGGNVIAHLNTIRCCAHVGVLVGPSAHIDALNNEIRNNKFGVVFQTARPSLVFKGNRLIGNVSGDIKYLPDD
jgi:hypothetical protein